MVTQFSPLASPVIQLVTPAFPIKSLDNLEKTEKLLASCGATVLRPTSTDGQQWYGGSHTERANEIIAALSNSAVDIVWAVRGGAGTTQVVAELEKRNFVPTGKPKLLIGYSDITALIMWWQKHGWPAMHGPTASASDGPLDKNGNPCQKNNLLAEAMALITGKTAHLHFDLTVLHNPQQNMEIITSITGGCILLVHEAIGSQTEPVTDGKILFLEDPYPKEPVYIAREVLSLIRRNFLQKAAALFIGKISPSTHKLTDEESFVFLKKELAEIFMTHNITIPIVHSPDFGHGTINHILPFDRDAVLNIIGNKATLTV